MEQIIDQILQWPVIMQGALGSGMFWLILKVGENAFRVSALKYLSFSKKNRLERLQAESIRYRAFTVEDKTVSSLLVICLIYGAMHYLIKALISLCLGLFLNGFIPSFESVGYLFALYFLFQAANAVRDTEPGIDKAGRLTEINSEISSLKKELNQ